MTEHRSNCASRKTDPYEKPYACDCGALSSNLQSLCDQIRNIARCADMPKGTRNRLHAIAHEIGLEADPAASPESRMRPQPASAGVVTADTKRCDGTNCKGHPHNCYGHPHGCGCSVPETPKQFMECDTCRAKPGSPTLCAGCLNNRRVIGDLQQFHDWAQPQITDLNRGFPGETTAVTRDTPIVREIFERHDRCSTLLWGPASLPGMMLGPMDADAAHSDRGTLLSLIPGSPVKTAAEPPPLCQCADPEPALTEHGLNALCEKCYRPIHGEPA